MFRRRRYIVLLSVFALVGLGALGIWRGHQAPLPPLEVALWYWHQPFHLTPAEVTECRTMGVRRLFVRAGTLRKTDAAVQLIMPQQWETDAGDLEIHLVFNFDYSIVRNFAALSNPLLIAAVRDAVGQARSRAERAGLHVGGFQLDFDCPTRRLSKYADLLRGVRACLPRPFRLSITALPTWYTSDDIQEVVDAVDFAVPQYYEPEISKTLDPLATVSRLRLLERGLQSAGRRGRPFYAGLPDYGRALLYDDQCRLVGLYRDLSLRDAARHPSFRLARAYPADRKGRPATRATWIGEDIYDFVAVRPAHDGRGKGYHLVYDLPTPALIAQHLALVRAQRPRECRGVILFRYPEQEGSMTLPLSALAAVLRGANPQPRLRVRLKAVSAPWDLIETGRNARRTPVDLHVTVTNVGDAGTYLAPDAVTLMLCFDRPGLEEAPLRDFDALDTFCDARSHPPSGLLPLQNDRTAPGPSASTALFSSLGRANLLRIRKFQLGVGETARFGPIRVSADGATRVWGQWSVTCMGGFDTVHDQIAPIDLVGQGG